MADIPLAERVIKISQTELAGKISTRADMYNILTQACKCTIPFRQDPAAEDHRLPLEVHEGNPQL